MSFNTSKAILDSNIKKQNEKTIMPENVTSLAENAAKSVRTRHRLMNFVKKTFSYRKNDLTNNIEKSSNSSLFSIKSKKSKDHSSPKSKDPSSPKMTTKKSTPLKKTNSNKSIYSTTTSASTAADSNSLCTSSSLDRQSSNFDNFSIVSSMACGNMEKSRDLAEFQKECVNRFSKVSKMSKSKNSIKTITSSFKLSEFSANINEFVPRVKLPVFLRQGGELLGISTKNTRIHENGDLIPIPTKADMTIKVNDMVVCNSHSISQNFITKELQNLQLIKKTRAQYQQSGCISDGQGSYGDVFAMENVKTGQKVAMKAISLRRNQQTRHNSQGFNEGILEEVKLESDILAEFKNAPGIVQFKGSCILNNQTVKNVNKRHPELREKAEMAYIFMEHGGTDLFRVMQNNDLSYFECLRIARGIVLGLNSLQNFVPGKKFVHADLKPGNILVNMDILKNKSQFKSTDELAKHDEKLVSLIDLLSCEATENNDVLKKDLCVTTPGYVAPEIVTKQCQREPRFTTADSYNEEDKLSYSAKSDCFAVGTLLTELVRGK